VILAGVAALLAVSVGLAPAGHDEERSAWRFRRSLVLAPLQGPPQAFAALTVPPEMAAECRDKLQDLRLLGPEGREVPYILDRLVEREALRSWGARLLDTQRERRIHSLWVLDLQAPRTFDAVVLDVPDQDFAKRLLVEASEDRRGWEKISEDNGIFDKPWGSSRIHHTRIEVGHLVTARYLRITADDRRSAPVDLRGAEVSAGWRVAGESWTRPASLQPVSFGSGKSRYRLGMARGLPAESLRLEADDRAFSRHVQIVETRDQKETVLSEGLLYRVTVEDEAVAAESLTLAIPAGPHTGELAVLIEDGDSPALRNPRASLSGVSTRVIFPAGEESLTAYYGNRLTRAPNYDLEALKGRLGSARVFRGATLGPEAQNSWFREMPPLSFVASRGATVDASRWQMRRKLSIAGAEDIYTLRLMAEDLAFLRRDLGDLRIVDEAHRQVPYIVEPEAAEEKVTVQVEGSRVKSREGSHYTLAIPSRFSKQRLALPVRALELSFDESFFVRPARLLATGPEREERLLASATLSRRAEDTGPLRIPLDETARERWTLEIDEGDNAPLTLRSVHAAVAVPRLAFKAAAGSYDLLFRNEEAPPPRYDIASLRREFLSYSAIPASAEALESNPGHRRLLGEYWTQAPPTVLLWGTLLFAVVVLLLLTMRILRQPPV